MKAPDFWYRPAGCAAKLLAPLGCFYRAGGMARRAVVVPYRLKIPLLCVGNIVAGGAGKTPAALALAELLKRRGGRPVFVSRGYGGSEPGPLFVEPGKHTAREVGDEALLLAVKAPCWIGRNRAAAVRAAEPHATHIILDDGLQNPTVAPSFSLLVIDGETGLGNERLIPAGPLRETLADALRRVDAVILVGEDKFNVTFPLRKGRNHESDFGEGSNNVNPSPAKTKSLLRKLRFLLPLPQGERKAVPVLRARLEPRLPDDFPRDVEYFAFAGIGHPEKFYATCREAGLSVISTLDFPDHHTFSAKELADLAEHARVRNLKLITTAKDAARLPRDFRAKVAVFPVELVFEDEERLMEAFHSSTTAPRLPS